MRGQRGFVASGNDALGAADCLFKESRIYFVLFPVVSNMASFLNLFLKFAFEYSAINLVDAHRVDLDA